MSTRRVEIMKKTADEKKNAERREKNRLWQIAYRKRLKRRGYKSCPVTVHRLDAPKIRALADALNAARKATEGGAS